MREVRVGVSLHTAYGGGGGCGGGPTR